MNSPAAFVVGFLTGRLLVGGTTGWPVSFASMPADGDRFVTVYDTTPVPDGRLMRTGEAITHPGIQVRVRAPDYQSGYEKASEIRKALTEQLLNSPAMTGLVTAWLVAFKLTADVTPLGQEEKNRRRMFVLNGTLTIRR